MHHRWCRPTYFIADSLKRTKPFHHQRHPHRKIVPHRCRAHPSAVQDSAQPVPRLRCGKHRTRNGNFAIRQHIQSISTAMAIRQIQNHNEPPCLRNLDGHIKKNNTKQNIILDVSNHEESNTLRKSSTSSLLKMSASKKRERTMAITSRSRAQDLHRLTRITPRINIFATEASSVVRLVLERVLRCKVGSGTRQTNSWRRRH